MTKLNQQNLERERLFPGYLRTEIDCLFVRIEQTVLLGVSSTANPHRKELAHHAQVLLVFRRTAEHTITGEAVRLT